jgi:colicin import membrane protein
MKHGQTIVPAQKSAVAARRSGAWACVFAVAALLPLPLNAAIDRNDDVLWLDAEATGGNFPYIAPDWSDQLVEAGDAVVPPVKREAPKTPDAPAGQAAPTPDAGVGPAPGKAPETTSGPASQPVREGSKDAEPTPLDMTDRIQDWLARANREFQSTVIRRLSTQPAGSASDDEIARKLEEVKRQDAEAAAAKRAEDERKAAEAKRAEEGKRKAAEAKRLDDEKAAEAKRIEEERQAAEAKRLEAERLVAEKASQKAAEEAKAKEIEPVPQPAAKPDDSARLAEEMRQERARLEAESDRIEAQRKAAEEKRIADQRAEDEARIAEERRRAAAAESEKNTKRSIVLTPEPISRPEADSSSVGREPSPSESGGDAKPSSGAAPRPANAYREASNLARGPAVKRWVWRARGTRCRFAGRRIVPPGRYTVRRGDSLWLIAKRHYRRGWLYHTIYRANRSIIRDPDLIYPCQRILVPRRG